MSNDKSAAISSLLTPLLLLLLLCGIGEEQASGVVLGGGPRIELPRSCMEIVSNSALHLSAGDGLGSDQSLLGQRLCLGSGEQSAEIKTRCCFHSLVFVP